MHVLGIFLLFFMFRLCAGQNYSASCANSFNQDYGIIELPRPSLFRKPPAIKCIWTFTAREGDSLSIKIHEFSVDKSRRCFRGYLEILDGLSSASSHILLKTCSALKTQTDFGSSSNSVTIVFYSRYFRHADKLRASVRTVSPSRFYKVHSSKKSWFDARDFCQKDHGDLASVFPVPSQGLTDLVESNENVAHSWVGQFVTPWVRLKGCIRWANRQNIEPRYRLSKYNQKIECSMACVGSAIFLLQGGSCYCLSEQSRVHLNDIVPAKECNIPCPGNVAEMCGGSRTFTYYLFYDEMIDNGAIFQDCVVDVLTSFEAKDCDAKFGFTCCFENGTAMTYLSTLPWNEAHAFCIGLPGSTGLRDFPHWPKVHVYGLWTSISRGQHWNYPQVYNEHTGPEVAYVAGKNMLYQYELKLRNTSYKYAFICEYHRSLCGGNYKAGSGDIQTPNYPDNYGYNQFCEWNITVPEGYRVRLEFSHFQLEKHEFCLYDYVKILDPVLPENLMDIRYCGLLAPRVYKSEGKKMSVIFKSDNTISETGFTAHWTAVHPEHKEPGPSTVSRTGIGGGAVAGVIIGIAVVVGGLFLLFFVIYQKRHKKETISGSTVSNQVYGISSFSNNSITDGNHSYINIQGQRNSHLVEQRYTDSVRDDLDDDDTDRRNELCYEMNSNRLDVDDAEYYENTGSQANLIVSDDEDIDDTGLCKSPHRYKGQIRQQTDNADSITVESTLSLDDIEKLGVNDITVVERQEEEYVPFDGSQMYEGAWSKDALTLESQTGNYLNIHPQTDFKSKNETANVLDSDVPPNKTTSLYRNLDDEFSHPAAVPTQSHTYEEMDATNNFEPRTVERALLNPLLDIHHEPVSQILSNAYAEIGDIDP